MPLFGPPSMRSLYDDELSRLEAAMADPAQPGIPPELVSRDPEIVRAYVEDPLVFEDRIPVECNAAGMEAAIGAMGPVHEPLARQICRAR